MASFIIRTDPARLSWNDLVRLRRVRWAHCDIPEDADVIRQVVAGDDAFIYHRGQEAIVGLARITSDPYEHPERRGRRGDGTPTVPVFDLEPVEPATPPLTFDNMRHDSRLRDLLVNWNGHAAIVPVADDLAMIIRQCCALRKPFGRWHPPAGP